MTVLEKNCKVLFLDDEYIEEKSGVTRTFHSVSKFDGNPIRLPKVAGGEVADGLEHAGERYAFAEHPRYDAARGVYVMGSALALGAEIGETIFNQKLPCYAIESRDGLHWEEVPLGEDVLYTAVNADQCPDGKLPQNLISCASTIESADPGPLGRLAADFIMFDSPKPEPDDVKHKYTRMGFSEDGIHWEVDFAAVPPQNVYDTSSMMYDTRKQKYVLYGRLWIKFEERTKGNREGFRKVMYSESDDCVHWTEPYVVLDTDELDPPRTEFYNLCVMNYGLYYIGFGEMLQYGVSWGERQDTNDMQLLWSHDGVTWLRTPQSAHNIPPEAEEYMREVDFEGDPTIGRPLFLPLGGPGEWDRFGIAMSPPIVMSDELRFYYSGRTRRHGPTEVDDLGVSWGAGGLATLRLDGFCSLDASYSGATQPTFGGQVVTKPFTLPAGRLFVNAASRFGKVVVELLDENDRVIPGYASDPIESDDVRIPVTFGAQVALDEIAGRPVKLQFRLMNARLYSFWVEKAGGESGVPS